MKAYFNKAIGRWQVTLSDGSRAYRYRLVMEEHLGRPLRDDEHVHHINGDKGDDRLENLQILSPSEHSKLHLPERVAGRRRLRGEAWGPDGLERCVECGSDERPYEAVGQCGRCYFRNRQRVQNGHSPRQPATFLSYVCEQCGERFERPLKRGRNIRFCTRSCASRATATARWAREKAAA